MSTSDHHNKEARLKQREELAERMRALREYFDENPIEDVKKRLQRLEVAHVEKTSQSDALHASLVEQNRFSQAGVDQAMAPYRELGRLPYVKAISSPLNNTAFIGAADVCVSISHSFCALLVLSNGKESAVMHLSSPGLLSGQALRAIKAKLGGHVQAKLYHADQEEYIARDRFEANRVAYMEAISDALGPGNIIETSNAYFPGYLVTPNGSVAPLTSSTERTLELELLPAHMTFETLHALQSEHHRHLPKSDLRSMPDSCHVDYGAPKPIISHIESQAQQQGPRGTCIE